LGSFYTGGVWDAKQIGKLGGKSKSNAKQQAARANGAKGGRPPKKPEGDKQWWNAAAQYNGPEREACRRYLVYHLVEHTDVVIRHASHHGKRLTAHDYLHGFWPLRAVEVKRELVRQGRRDLWNRLQEHTLKTQAGKPLLHSQ
jgi:hypothetical protein